MKKIITLLALIFALGCQTKNKTQAPLMLNQAITVTVNQVNHLGFAVSTQDEKTSYELELTTLTPEGKPIIRKISLTPDKWGKSDAFSDIKGFSYTARVLLDDEMVEINCEPGLHFTAKAEPLGNGKVRLKGIYVYNKMQNNVLTRQAPVYPFNVICESGKPTVIYEIKMELEPVRGP